MSSNHALLPQSLLKQSSFTMVYNGVIVILLFLKYEDANSCKDSVNIVQAADFKTVVHKNPSMSIQQMKLLRIFLQISPPVLAASATKCLIKFQFNIMSLFRPVYVYMRCETTLRGTEKQGSQLKCRPCEIMSLFKLKAAQRLRPTRDGKNRVLYHTMNQINKTRRVEKGYSDNPVTS